jgi:hypothetical protein
MYQQLWRYKVGEKLYLGVREQKRLNTTGLGYAVIKIQLLSYKIDALYEKKTSVLLVFISIAHMLIYCKHTVRYKRIVFIANLTAP